MLPKCLHHIPGNDRLTIGRCSWSGVEGACDSVPSKRISTGCERKLLAALWVGSTRFSVDTHYFSSVIWYSGFAILSVL